MPRREDIEDIPMLMPESDEIQAFRGGAKQSAAEQVGATPSHREAAIRPAPATRSSAPTEPSAPKRSVGLWLFCILTLLMVALGGWWMHYRVISVEDMLTVSRGELGHARKRIGELEALVVATDVNTNKSGTVVQAQVKKLDDRTKERNKFIDSEIDKLWGVAYRSNKPAIVEAQKAAANNSVGIKQHTEQLSAQTALIEKQQELVAGQQEQLVDVVAAFKALTVKVADQANSLDKTLASMKAQDGDLKQAQAALQAVRDTNDETVGSVNKIQQTLLKMRAADDEAAGSVSKMQQTIMQLRAADDEALGSVNEIQQTLMQLQVADDDAAGSVNEVQQVLMQLRAANEILQEGIADLKVSSQLNADVMDQTSTRLEVQEQAAAAVDSVALSNLVAQLQADLSSLQRQVRVAGVLEQAAAELDERLYMTEQSLDSITAFRQATNRKLDQLANQIRTLQYSE